ncbi:MAG: hypothetical protein J6K89_00760 [Oscillospiraceae bacterium]|nr:hypothetical protein [Oscillospiraceae bacterium]
MKCGNCGAGNEYGATVCAKCGSTLSLTEVFRPTGFVEKQPLHELFAKEKEAELLKEKNAKVQQRQTESFDYEPQTRQQSTSRERRNGQRSGSDRPPRNGKKEAPHSSEKKRQPAEPRSEARSKQRRIQEPTQTKARKQSEQPKPLAKKPAPYREEDPNRAAVRETPKKPKRAPTAKAYNRTTRTLSIAEKFVKKKSRKRSWKWVIPVILILVIVAGAILLGTMQSAPKDDSYTKVAEDFVEAVVMNDADGAAACIHPNMHGKLRSMNYKDVERCEAKTIRYDILEPGQLELELQQRYGIQDPVTKLYRVHIGYTIYGERNYACTMDVLVANIGGRICAVKTENIDDSQQSNPT